MKEPFREAELVSMLKKMLEDPAGAFEVKFSALGLICSLANSSKYWFESGRHIHWNFQGAAADCWRKRSVVFWRDILMINKGKKGESCYDSLCSVLLWTVNISYEASFKYTILSLLFSRQVWWRRSWTLWIWRKASVNWQITAALNLPHRPAPSLPFWERPAKVGMPRHLILRHT